VSGAVKIANYQRPVNLLEISQRNRVQSAGEKGADSFTEMFSRELAGSRDVQFSKHASKRLFSRGIELNDELLDRISDAIDRAQQKGSKETLILTDDAAMVVSVENRTVVTAFGRDSLREGVVTSIDSAVIL
jgi:flagellar operon protein